MNTPRVKNTGLQGLAIAFGVHALLVVALMVVEPRSRAASVTRRPPVRVRLVKRTPPAEKPKAQPEPRVKPVRPEPPKQRRFVRRKSIKRASTPAQAPKAAAAKQTAPQPQKSAPRFRVAIDATVNSSAVAVPTGTTRQGVGGGGVPGGSGGKDAEEKKGSPAKPPVATLADVMVKPRLIYRPPRALERKAYPGSARRRGLEADVQLKILVSPAGSVSAVRVLRKAGNGFDQVAERLVRLLRFRAGRKGSRPVAVWIPWTYKFRLADG